MINITVLDVELDSRFERADTPRTNAAQHNMGSVAEPHYVVDVEVARQLERELAEAQAEIVRLKGEAELWEGGFDRACDHLAEIRDRRDKAIAFLHVYRNDTPLGNQPHMIAHDVDQFLKECGK